MGFNPLHDAMVSLGRRVLRLWLLVTRWRRPTFIITSKIPRLSLQSPSFSNLVPAPRSHPHQFPFTRSRPRCRLRPVPVPLTVSSLPSLMPCTPPDTTSSGSHRALQQKLLPTCGRHPLSTEMMPREEWQCLVLHSTFLLMW